MGTADDRSVGHSGAPGPRRRTLDKACGAGSCVSLDRRRPVGHTSLCDAGAVLVVATTVRARAGDGYLGSADTAGEEHVVRARVSRD
jgi:hypothetical protein